MAAFLAIIGTSLFLGEWLLGSIGWGVLHGVLLFVSAAVGLVLWPSASVRSGSAGPCSSPSSWPS